jgi:hypothetical protein
MSRIILKSHAVLGAAILTAIFSAACSDATGPSNGKPVAPTSETSAPRPSGGPGRGTDSTSKAADLKPSLLVQTGSQISGLPGSPTAPGSVWFPVPAVGVTVIGTSRVVNVSGIRVYDVPGNYGTWATAARADVYLWRWNGSSWGSAPYMTGTSPTGGIFPNKFVDLPTVSLYPRTAGHYAVTVRITWTTTAYWGPSWFAASRDFWFNSASDYFALGGATVYPGCVVIQ